MFGVEPGAAGTRVDIRPAHPLAHLNLALALLQRLAELSMLPTDSSQLLSRVSTTIYAVENPFGEEQILVLPEPY